MLAALSILIVRLIAFFYGKPATHFFPTIRHPKQGHRNLLLPEREQFPRDDGPHPCDTGEMFGPSGFATFIKLNLIHYLFFASAFVIFLLLVPGFHGVSSFVSRGFTVELDANERTYLPQHYNDIEPQEGLSSAVQ